VVSVRQGTRYDKSVSQFESMRGRLDWRLHLEDPFDLSRNLRDVLRWENERQLMEHIWMMACHLSPMIPLSVRQGRRGSRRGKEGPNFGQLSNMPMLPMLLPGMHGMPQYLFGQSMQPNMRGTRYANKQRNWDQRKAKTQTKFQKALPDPKPGGAEQHHSRFYTSCRSDNMSDI